MRIATCYGVYIVIFDPETNTIKKALFKTSDILAANISISEINRVLYALLVDTSQLVLLDKLQEMSVEYPYEFLLRLGF